VIAFVGVAIAQTRYFVQIIAINFVAASVVSLSISFAIFYKQVIYLSPHAFGYYWYIVNIPGIATYAGLGSLYISSLSTYFLNAQSFAPDRPVTIGRANDPLYEYRFPLRIAVICIVLTAITNTLMEAVYELDKQFVVDRSSFQCRSAAARFLIVRCPSLHLVRIFLDADRDLRLQIVYQILAVSWV
jgi:hypothetical protein